MPHERHSSMFVRCGVAVIGGGLAGHCAAIAAVEAGAEVIMVEKQPAIGGSTVLSGGFFGRGAGQGAASRAALARVA